MYATVCIRGGTNVLGKGGGRDIASGHQNMAPDTTAPCHAPGADQRPSSLALTLSSAHNFLFVLLSSPSSGDPEALSHADALASGPKLSRCRQTSAISVATPAESQSSARVLALSVHLGSLELEIGG